MTTRLSLIRFSLAVTIATTAGAMLAPAIALAAPAIHGLNAAGDADDVDELLLQAAEEAKQPASLPAAEKHYQRVLVLTHRKNGEALLALGRIRGDQSDLPAAVALDREAIAVAPDNPAPVAQLGQHLVRQKNYDDAQHVAEDGIKRFPKHASLYRVLAKVYVNQGKPDDAINTLNQAKTIDPTDAETHIDLAMIYVDQKKPDQAAAEMSLGAKAGPKNFDRMMSTGQSLVSLNDFDRAYLFYLAAAEIKPTVAEPENNLGFVMVRKALADQKAGHSDDAKTELADAKQHFNRAIKLKPGFESAIKNLKTADAIEAQFAKLAAAASTQP